MNYDRRKAMTVGIAGLAGLAGIAFGGQAFGEELAGATLSRNKSPYEALGDIPRPTELIRYLEKRIEAAKKDTSLMTSLERELASEGLALPTSVVIPAIKVIFPIGSNIPEVYNTFQVSYSKGFEREGMQNCYTELITATGIGDGTFVVQGTYCFQFDRARARPKQDQNSSGKTLLEELKESLPPMTAVTQIMLPKAGMLDLLKQRAAEGTLSKVRPEVNAEYQIATTHIFHSLNKKAMELLAADGQETKGDKK